MRLQSPAASEVGHRIQPKQLTVEWVSEKKYKCFSQAAAQCLCQTYLHMFKEGCL